MRAGSGAERRGSDVFDYWKKVWRNKNPFRLKFDLVRDRRFNLPREDEEKGWVEVLRLENIFSTLQQHL